MSTNTSTVNSIKRASGMRIILRMMIRYPGLLLTILGLAILSGLLAAPTPYLGKILIDEIVFKNAGKLQPVSHAGWFGISDALWMLGTLVLLGVGLKLLSSLVAGWQSYYILQITRNALYRMRLEAALRLMGAPQRFFESLEPGKIASRLTNDVNQVDSAIFFILRYVTSSVFLLVILVVFMLAINPLLTLIVFITIPLTGIFSYLSFRRLHHFSKAESDRTAALTAGSAETFGAIKIVRAFAAEPFFLRRIQERCEALRYEGIRHWTVYHVLMQLLGLLTNLGGDIFLFVGGIMALNGKITFGDFFAFYGYQSMLWGPVSNLFNGATLLQSGSASAEKINEMLTIEQELYLEKESRPLRGDFRGEIVCESLHFNYGDEPLLQDISLKIAPGSMVALVGHSGAGKTTLASLLMGLYLPTDGKLLIDGVDIRDWNLRDLRSQIGVVLQESVMFNDTVRANLCLGRTDFSDDRIWAALQAAHLADTVRQFPETIDTPLGVNGARLSGGEKQRLAIARVILRNPRLLIMDEATSALDSKTEKAIQRSFDALMAGRTCIVIAHRLSTIFDADQIVVLHQGRMVEKGTHGELVQKQEGHYRKLYETQVQGMIPMSGATRRPWARQPAG